MRPLLLNESYGYKVFVMVVVVVVRHYLLHGPLTFYKVTKKDSSPPNSLLLLRYL